jgi:prepilin-type N-terminal cleavage/methylation domain-containing protein
MALAKFCSIDSTPTEFAGLSAVAGRRSAGEGGFSLLEVLVASTIMAVALTTLAQLFVMSTNANTGAKTTTYAAVLAQQKMEQLRGLAWGFDTLGLPVTDISTDISVVPEQPIGGTGLAPGGSLGQNIRGYCDFIDKNGVSLGTGTTPTGAAVYIRRWTVEPLPTNPNNTIVLQVLVTRWRNRGTADTQVGTGRQPDEARIISVKTRKAT